MASDEKRSAITVELEHLAAQWEKSAHDMAYWAGMSDANDASKDRGVAGAQMDCASQLRRLLRRHPADEASAIRAENAAMREALRVLLASSEERCAPIDVGMEAAYVIDDRRMHAEHAARAAIGGRNGS